MVSTNKEKEEMVSFLVQKKKLYTLLYTEVLNQIEKEKSSFNSLYEIYFSLMNIHFNFLKRLSSNARLVFIKKSLP